MQNLHVVQVLLLFFGDFVLYLQLKQQSCENLAKRNNLKR